MPTVAQRFYGTKNADDQAFSGENQIRDVQETGTGLNDAYGTITWTTTTITEKTYIPNTANSTAGNTSQNNGFAFNNGGADGMGSTSSQKRLIPAGAWRFRFPMSLNTPALLDTHALTVTAYVYRVATGGGTRTLLFSATSANQTGTADVQWDSASQPQYTLEAGEVIMVGYTATSASTTATVLGANTNTVMTVYINDQQWFEVPAPGVRSLYPLALADGDVGPETSEALTRVMLFPRALSDAPSIAEALARIYTGARALADSPAVTEGLDTVISFPRALDDNATASDAIARQFTGSRALADSAPASDGLVRQFTGARALADSAPAADSLARQFVGARSLDDVIGGVSDQLARVAIFNRALADGASVSDALLRAFVGNRALDDSPSVSDALTRQAIYDRQLEDNLSEGGGTTITRIFAILD